MIENSNSMRKSISCIGIITMFLLEHSDHQYTHRDAKKGKQYIFTDEASRI